MKHPIIFFDGDCNLCNGFIRILIRLDRNQVFRFSSLQSDFGFELLKRSSGIPENSSTIILLHDDKLFFKSEAVIKICEILGFPWRLILITKIFPTKMRDKIYDFIARKRYKWFGVSERCVISLKETEHLFLK